MDGNGFEWDDAKAAANYAKHGVAFDRARLVFVAKPTRVKWNSRLPTAIAS